MSPTKRHQLWLIREDAQFTARRIGAPGSKVRQIAESTLQLLEEHEKLIAACEAAKDALEGSYLSKSVHDTLELLDRTLTQVKA